MQITTRSTKRSTLRFRALNRERAFTLVELLVVILIIGILLAIALPTFLNQQNSAHDAAAKQDLNTAYKVAASDAASNGGSYRNPATVAAVINASEPELGGDVQAISSASDLNSLPAGTVGILTSGNGSFVALEESSSGNLCTLTIADHAVDSSVCAAQTSPTQTATEVAWQDSYANSLNPGTTYDTSQSLDVGPSYLLSVPQERAFVQFSLPPIPSNMTLQSATLRLYATVGTPGRTIEAYEADNSWSASALTWGNQPGTTGTAAESASRATPGWQEWDVTSAVANMYSSANTGFRLQDSFAGAVQSSGSVHQVYSSGEGPNPPQLVLVFG